MFLHLGTFLSNGTFLHFGYAIRNFTVNTLHNTTVTLSVSGSSSAMKQIPRNMILRERERERRARAHTHTHTLIFPEGRERLFTLNTYMTHMGVQDISPFRIPSSRQITTIKQHEYYSRRRRQQLLLLLLLTRWLDRPVANYTTQQTPKQTIYHVISFAQKPSFLTLSAAVQTAPSITANGGRTSHLDRSVGSRWNPTGACR